MEGKHLQTHFVPQKSESALKELRVIRVKADISWMLSHRNVAWNVFTLYYTLISITDMTSHLSMSWPSWPSVSETGSEGGAAAGSSSDPEDVRDGELIMGLLKVIPYSHLTPRHLRPRSDIYLISQGATATCSLSVDSLQSADSHNGTDITHINTACRWRSG